MYFRGLGACMYVLWMRRGRAAYQISHKNIGKPHASPPTGGRRRVVPRSGFHGPAANNFSSLVGDRGPQHGGSRAPGHAGVCGRAPARLRVAHIMTRPLPYRSRNWSRASLTRDRLRASLRQSQTPHRPSPPVSPPPTNHAGMTPFSVLPVHTTPEATVWQLSLPVRAGMTPSLLAR